MVYGFVYAHRLECAIQGKTCTPWICMCCIRLRSDLLEMCRTIKAPTQDGLSAVILTIAHRPTHLQTNNERLCVSFALDATSL